MSFKQACCCSVALATFAGIWAPASAQDVRTDEIIVTASPIGRTTEETIAGNSVIGGDELQDRLESSIGETLRREPGISSTFFGPAASRPVIRGLGGDRISVLDSGIGSIDASAASPDHAVAVEPAMAEKIEIVRGAGTLLYGSSAAGGVINVFSGRIPRTLPEDGIDGSIRIGGSTVDSAIETAGGFDVKLTGDETSGLIFHGEGAYRKTEDYKIPGYPRSTRLRIEEGPDPVNDTYGVERNSALESKSGSAGLSYVFEDGFIGVSGTEQHSFYGIPASDEAEPDGTGPHIQLEQKRVDFNAEINRDFLLFKTARMRFGYADYTHTELEPSGEEGTVFSNEGYEGRLELIDKPITVGAGEINGALGFQFRSRDFAAIGEESFVPAVKTHEYGVFALKEYAQGDWRFELSGRYESTTHDVIDTGDKLNFDAYSVSAGIGYEPMDGVFFGVTGLRSERAPQSEELFANGPHLATGAYETGDPTLRKETARGVEATMRLGGDKIAFTVNGFYTSYKGFIFESNTGTFYDLDGEDIPIYRFSATDATFKGFESKLEAELFHVGAFDIHGDAAMDYVRATADASPTGDLPRIPPLSGIFGLDAKSGIADLRGEIEYAAKQDKIGAEELPTDSYTLYNFYVTLRPFTQAGDLAIRLAALNVTDEEARLHTSFLKDRAPLPGRNFRVSLTGSF
ncbi:MAG: TonB-dependent receptor [Caulobacterales bacterium]|mgnify:CR=1 FL=1|nr:TonB-dependent receptor [Caulobacterales bacterium]